MISIINFRRISAVINLVLRYGPCFLKNITWFVSECIPRSVEKPLFHAQASNAYIPCLKVHLHFIHFWQPPEKIIYKK